jgi:uroporphyrinogen-III synthase
VSDDRPLAGRRVVVTRPRDQATSLVELLEERGARPIVVPLTDVVDEPSGMAALRTADVTAFDWVIVTSANAARRLVDAHGSKLAESSQLAAVGTQTAAVLGHCQLVPIDQRAEGLLADLPAEPASAFVVQAVEAAPTLVDGLRSRGWRVTAVTPYRSVASRPSAAEQLAALAADAVLFASGSAARAWVEVFGTSTPPVVVAMGAQTAGAAQAAGVPVTVVAADHSVAGLVAALEAELT